MRLRNLLRLAVVAAVVAVLALGAFVGAHAVAYAAPVFYVAFIAAVGDTALTFAEAVKRRNALVRYYGSSMGGRLRAMSSLISVGFNLIFAIISAVIAFVIVAKMFPTISDAAYELQTAASQSNNTLIQILAPVMPYIIGIGLLVVIMLPINYLLDRIASRAGIGRGTV